MSASKKQSRNFGSSLAGLGIGKTKILEDPIPVLRPIPLQLWRQALICSPWCFAR